MSVRMQVLIPDGEYRRLQRLAKQRGLTLAEWVRQALRSAGREEPEGAPEKKLAVVRNACRHTFPAGDLDTMLREIESGYLKDGPR